MSSASGYSDMFGSLSADDMSMLHHAASSTSDKAPAGVDTEEQKREATSAAENNQQSLPVTHGVLPSPPSSPSSSSRSSRHPSIDNLGGSHSSPLQSPAHASRVSSSTSSLGAQSVHSLHGDVEANATALATAPPMEEGQTANEGQCCHSTSPVPPSPPSSLSSSSPNSRSVSSSSKQVSPSPPPDHVSRKVSSLTLHEGREAVVEHEAEDTMVGSASQLDYTDNTAAVGKTGNSLVSRASSSPRSSSSSSGKSRLRRSSSTSSRSYSQRQTEDMGESDTTPKGNGKGVSNSDADPLPALSATKSSAPVPETQAASHSPSSNKKVVAPRTTTVKPLHVPSISSATSPQATTKIATTPTPQTHRADNNIIEDASSPQRNGSKPPTSLLKTVPPTCRHILMDLVPYRSDSDEEEEYNFEKTPSSTAQICDRSTVSAGNGGEGDTNAAEVDRSSANHQPHRPKSTSHGTISARQKYLNSVDMTFLVSAPLLGRGRVGRQVDPISRGPSVSVSPRRPTRAASTAGDSNTATKRMITPSPCATRESTEWTVDRTTSTPRRPSTTVSQRKPSTSTPRAPTAQKGVPSNYFATLHRDAEALKEKREEQRRLKEEALAKDMENKVTVSAPSERLYTLGAVPKGRYERYKELAREAGEEVDNEEDVAEDRGAISRSGAPQSSRNSGEVTIAKWVLTRTAVGGGEGADSITSVYRESPPSKNLHKKPRENDEVFDRLSTIRRHRTNVYKDVQIGGRPLTPLDDETLGELNERMYGRWMDRKEKEKKVREDKAAAASAAPVKRVCPEDIAEKMYTQPMELKAKKLAILHKKQEDELAKQSRTISIGYGKPPREVTITGVSIKTLSQRQYYQPMAKKAAWRENTVKALEENDRKHSVSKGPIDASRWEDIIQRNVYDASTHHHRSPHTTTPVPPKGILRGAGSGGRHHSQSTI